MSKAKILIVEDELITAKVIRSVLENLGYDVLDIVTSGEEAIQKVSEVRPDLILMDIKLGGEMDGIEAARQIKDRFYIPVVYLTAHADDATLERAKITEPFGYILKPFQDRDLHIGIEIALYKHKMENTLLQSEKLKSLGTITSGISHEFNNILASIMGIAEVLEGGFEDDAELRRGLKNIIKASERGAGIVKNMLAFAVPERDTSNYVFFDIGKLIRQAIVFTSAKGKNMAQSKGIHNDIDTDGMKEIPEVFCSPAELTRVFINIINNAMDAMPGSGRISFSTESNENAVLVSVSDTGEGMPEDVKKKIFDPFFTTRRPEGTGLGMSVAYSIIKKHGGTIEVESEEGKGTTINLSIPIRIEAVQKTEQPEPVRKETEKKLRILVADDNEDTCEFMYNFLTRVGHRVKTVNNGTDAIELAVNEGFDLVLCDLAMPDVTGYDVVRKLNKLNKRPKIGIITGWNEKLKLLDEEDIKVDFILEKPFNFAELVKHINEVFATG